MRPAQNNVARVLGAYENAGSSMRALSAGGGLGRQRDAAALAVAAAAAPLLLFSALLMRMHRRLQTCIRHSGARIMSAGRHRLRAHGCTWHEIISNAH